VSGTVDYHFPTKERISEDRRDFKNTI